MDYILIGILLVLLVFLTVQALRCRKAVELSRKRLASYHPKTMKLSFGAMTYVDNQVQGEVILSVQGIFGGYDQAYDTCRDFASDYRIIAPARFGYLGSDVLGKGTPAEQAKAYAELLDGLGLEKVFVLATSAGGSVAIRFALDYPERTKGLILLCSAMPFAEKPKKYMKYAGPPAFLCNNFMMYLCSPMFEKMMGLEAAVIHEMLPIRERKKGVIIDATITNIDMAKSFDDYQIESLRIPVIIFHAKDDKMASYEQTEKAVGRFPNCRFVSFETGGHLLKGHAEEMNREIEGFIRANS